MGGLGLTFLGILLFLSSVFMIMLILVQRGKGGGLTGALGGMGGQSAFGSKAGDVFTRITVITAIIWITLCMITIAIYNPPPPPAAKSDSEPAIMSTDDETDDGEMGAGDQPAVENGEDATEPSNIDEELEKALDADFSDDPALDDSDGGTGGDTSTDDPEPTDGDDGELLDGDEND